MKIFIRTVLLKLLVAGLALLHSSPGHYNSLKDGNKDDLLGFWQTEKKDLKVQVYRSDEIFFGKVIDFECTCVPKKSKIEHFDTKNPDKDQRSRSWVNAVVVYGLKYKGNNKWEDGYIYDLQSGKTYFASATLHPDKLEVRGYWVFEFLGRSMYFWRTK